MAKMESKLISLIDGDSNMSYDAGDNSVLLSSLCWQNMSVRGKRIEKQGLLRKTSYTDFQIVEKTSGFLSSGSLLALMGPSGSGKTTLLAAISRRMTAGVEGNVYINGHLMTADQMRPLSGFTPQDDLMHPTLTVLEHFKFTATLKMHRDKTDVHRMEKISTLMETIGLQNLASSYVSDLSGGERKKLCIALELLNDPPVLFCDEPTTGLDSAWAGMVIRVLKVLTSQGKIVVCTIHQPAAAVYELFDQVLLLASEGRTIYFGPVSEALDYFQRLGLACPLNYNVATFLIDKVSVTDRRADERIKFLREQYFNSKLKVELEERMRHHIDQVKEEGLMEFISVYFNTRKPTLLTQSATLIHRSLLDTKKNNTKIMTLFATLIFISSIFAGLFGEVTLCSPNSLQNIRGSLAMWMNFLALQRLFYHIDSVLSEKSRVMREINDGLYRTAAYCISTFIAKVAIITSESVIVTLVLKCTARMYDHVSFWSLTLPLIATNMSNAAFGCMLASMFDDLSILKLVESTFCFLSIAFSGMIVSLNSLPKVLGYFRYLFTVYYCLEYLLVLEFSEALHQNIQCQNNTSSTPAIALNFLANMGYDVQHYQKNIWILFSFFLIFYIMTYAFLCKKSREPVVY